MLQLAIAVELPFVCNVHPILIPWNIRASVDVCSVIVWFVAIAVPLQVMCGEASV